MHDIDPYKDSTPVDPVVTPVVPATPVVDPTVGPVTPVTVAVEPEYRAGPNPYPYVAGFVLLVLGIWGLFAFNSRDTGHPTSNYGQVGYVEQTLAPQPSPFSNEARPVPTTDRMAEDQTRDHMKSLAREEAARDAGRKDGEAGQTVRADYDDEVASVDLSTDAATGRQEAPTTLPAPDTVPALAPETVQTPRAGEAATMVAVQDLDYSGRTDIAPLTEFELRAQLTQLDADIDATEGMARDTNQTTGLETLDERLDALEDRFGDSKSPLQQADLLAMTQQVYELRDELNAFQIDIRGL